MPVTMNVLFLAAEAEPFIKVGGLADVAGSLPASLHDLAPRSTGGYTLDVRLVLPLHASIKSGSTPLMPLMEYDLPTRRGPVKAQVFQGQHGNTPVYFIAGEPVSSATSVYSDDLVKDREKYAFFSLAALEMIRRMTWRVDLLHANDWHTALALYALKQKRRIVAYRHVRSVLTLHNLPFSGGDGADVLAQYRLLAAQDASLPKWARTSPLPLGLWAADAIVAVSPTYAREVLTLKFGCGLEGFLRGQAGKLTGILNGLDTASFDPARDAVLASCFDRSTIGYRPANKSALQKKLALPVNAGVPLLGMVGRIDLQKGFDLVLEALRRMSARPWQVVLLGTGNRMLEQAARQLQADIPDRLRFVQGYDAQLGRLIYGGADIFLMPSRYEPCGLAQMIAMRYGCVPVVSRTGGLKDTVRDGVSGFHARREDLGSLVSTIERALDVLPDERKWREMQLAGMGRDFSWQRSARRYASLYRSLVLPPSP